MSETLSREFQTCIDRMNAGDASARAELLEHAGTRMQRLAHRMLQDYPRVRRWEDTGDVLQNAVLRLLSALQAVPIASAAEFFRLAALQIRRELLDLARHYYGPQGHGFNHASALVDANQQDTQRPGPDGSDTTYAPEKLAAWTDFHTKVESLPADEKAVFDLLWYQELSQADAAEILQVSVPTIKRRWLAARLRLQEVLKISEQD